MKRQPWRQMRSRSACCLRLRRLAACVTSVTLSLSCLQVISPNAEAAQKIRYFHPDHLGSTNVVTDENGQVVEVIEYKPFGEISRRSGSDNVPHTFTGQRLDDSTGLYYYKARYYDAQLGRFIQPDTLVQTPADPQTLNRYSYVRNNPVKYIDPTGHSFWKAFKRVYIALVTLGMSETIPATTRAIVSLSDKAGVDPRYPLALYSAVTGAFTGGIGWGVSAAFTGALSSAATSLAMASGEGREVTQKVAKEFFMDVVGMSPRSAYTAASITVSTAISAALQAANATARYAYNKAVNYDATWSKGGQAQPKTQTTLPIKGANNIGVQGGPPQPNSLWHEGGFVSRWANEVPGINAVAGMHDVFQVNLNALGGATTGWTLNVPGMPVAAAITYSALAVDQKAMPAIYAVGAARGFQQYELFNDGEGLRDDR